MRRAAFCALALAAVLVQVVLVDGLRLPGGAVPDIALVLVVTAGLTQGPLTGMLTGFAAGIGLDLAPPGGTLIGASALIFCLIGYCCGRLGARLQRLAPGLLAVAAIAVGAGEAAQAAAGLIAPGSGVTVAAVRSGLPATVLYDVVLCAALLSAAALVRARPWARRPAGQAARSRALASRRARRALGESPARQGRGAPRGAGNRWDAGVLAFSRAGRQPNAAVAVAGLPRREVPLRLGAMANEGWRAGSRPGGARGGLSGPRRLGPGRGHGVRRTAPRPDRGDPALRQRQRSGLLSGAARLRLRTARTLPRRQPDRPVRVRFGGRWLGGALFRGTGFRGARFRWAPVRARESVPGSLSAGTFARGRFRRQARMCRRVPRWTGTRSAPRAAGYGRAGGPR